MSSDKNAAIIISFFSIIIIIVTMIFVIVFAEHQKINSTSKSEDLNNCSVIRQYGYDSLCDVDFLRMDYNE